MSFLQAEALIGSYGGAPILNGCSLSLDRGQMAVIVGPNGAGKSTAMKAVLGMLRLTSGRVTPDRRDITALAPQARIRAGMAFVPHTENVFPALTVFGILQMGALLRRDAIDGTLDEIFALLPILADKRHQPAGQLSGGQRQQLAVGRALMTQPSVLLLDEPTAGVSPNVMDELFDKITRIAAQGPAVMMVEQNAAGALEIADAGFVLMRGANRFTDTGRDLLADPETRRSFLGGPGMSDLLNGLVHLTSMLLLPGLAYGSQLALGALGVTLIFGVLRSSSFAHAEGLSLATAVTILLTIWLQGMGVSLGVLPTALLGMAVPVMALVFIGTDRALYRHFRRINARPEVFMIVSAGVMLIMNGVIRLVIGPDGRDFEDGERFIVTARGFRDWSGLAEPLVLKTSQMLTIGLAVAAALALFAFLNRTQAGRSMRAYADNRNLTLLSGVDPDRIVRLTWILVAVLSVLAGVLFGLDKGYRPFVYQQLLLPMFAAAVVGGLGSPVGAIVGSMIVAFSELALTYLLPAALAPEGMMQLLSNEYKFAVSFLILVIVLLVRPAGLLGKVAR